jgi:VWA domain-containing protein
MIESRYEFVDRIPEPLFDAVVNHAHGMLRPRAEAILVLRDELLSGRVPPPEALGWPDDAVRRPLLDGLARSRIAQHCEANVQITDEVLRAILGAVGAAQRRYDELIAEWTLAARERDRRTVTVGLLPGGDEAYNAACDEVLLDEATWNRIRTDAARIASEVAAEALARCERDWERDARDWAAIRALFTELARVCDVDRARLHGLLAAVDWRRSAELRKLLAGLPAVQSLVTQLGRRSRPRTDDAERELESPRGTILRDHVTEVQVRELGVVEIRGVERSDEIARMLGSELALLARPATRLWWHARRAERSLLTYHAESVYTNRIATEQAFRAGADVAHPRAERGPIIILLDTSGSMAGSRELLAKALVLQALAVAELEEREVYVYNFSGDGQLVEHELSLRGDGLAHAIAFLTVSFGGSTEIDEALRRAVRRAQTEAWAGADLLIVTDGLFDHPQHRFDRATIQVVNAARRRGQFRIHVALTVGLIRDGVHAWFDEEDSPAPDDVGDPHWVIKAIADHIHELAEWIDQLAPVS